MRAIRDPLLVIVILLSMLIGSFTLTRGQDWGDDFASYIMQAQSIVDGTTGNFVKHNSFTISKSSVLIGPVSYPWGYPLLLTPVYALKGLHPLGLKLPALFFYAGFLLCLFCLTRHRFTRIESLLLISLFAFNPMLIGFLDYILSDIPFLFFSTWALLLMVNKAKRDLPYDVLLGFVIACAFLIRTQGILLLLDYMVLRVFDLWAHKTDKAFVNNKIKAIIFILGGFGFLWAIYAVNFPGGNESYFTQYSIFKLETAFGFMNSYFQVFSVFLGEGTIWRYLYYVLFAFFSIGAWTRRKEEAVFIVFFLIWMLLLITWPYWQGPRFIFPLLPVFIYFTFWGMKTVIARLPEKHQQNGRIIFTGFWFVIAGIFLFTSISNAYINLKLDRAINGPFDKISTEMFTFVKENTPPDSVVIFFKPRAMRLFTDRDSIMAIECDRLSLGNYVVINKKWDNSQIPPDKIEECKRQLTDVFENRRFIVYEIQR